MKKNKLLLIASLSLISFYSFSTTYYFQVNKELTKNVVIKKESEKAPVLSDWVHTDGDSCNGFRQSNANPSIYYIRAKYDRYSLGDFPEIFDFPEGYRRATLQEYRKAIPQGTSSDFVYANVCGITGYSLTDVIGRSQSWFYLADNYAVSKAAIEGREWTTANINGANSNFAGFILIKE